jgi:hypothetical protein
MRNRRRALPILVCLCATVVIALLALGGLAAGTGRQTATDVVSAVKTYTSWVRITPAPYKVSPALGVLCAAPNVSPMNPHSNAYINVFVNEAGRAAMIDPRDSAFPAGSVIVKEKLHDDQSVEPDLLTVMIKREPGYNPSAGNWEFAVVDGKVRSAQAQGKLANCMECHMTVSHSDYVFRTYLIPPR